MDNSIINATVAVVPFGKFEIEGLLLENGEYAIAQQQVASIFLVIPTSAPKWLKTSLGEGFQLFSVNTNRRKQAGKQNRNENALTLVQFERLLRNLDRKGNRIAQDLVDQLIGLSLQQLFADAFNQKFEKEERQAYLVARQSGKISRRTMTDAIKDWCDRNNKPEKITGYCCACSESLNVFLFGKKSAQLKQERNVSEKQMLRDFLTSQELYNVDRIEDRVAELVDLDNLKPTDAIKLVIERQTKLRGN